MCWRSPLLSEHSVPLSLSDLVRSKYLNRTQESFDCQIAVVWGMGTALTGVLHTPTDAVLIPRLKQAG
eukprot:m.432615 g.432615  ORF g.432615 m.432615 type:complete len:68 (+) comp89759_c0_seq1:30-233(+)